MASAQAVSEALWLRKLLGDFGIKVGTTPANTDREGSLKLLKHPIAAMALHLSCISVDIALPLSVAPINQYMLCCFVLLGGHATDGLCCGQIS